YCMPGNNNKVGFLFPSLPTNDLNWDIFSLLFIADLVRVMRVNRTWREVISTNRALFNYWFVWLNVFSQEPLQASADDQALKMSSLGAEYFRLFAHVKNLTQRRVGFFFSRECKTDKQKTTVIANKIYDAALRKETALVLQILKAVPWN